MLKWFLKWNPKWNLKFSLFGCNFKMAFKNRGQNHVKMHPKMIQKKTTLSRRWALSKSRFFHTGFFRTGVFSVPVFFRTEFFSTGGRPQNHKKTELSSKWVPGSKLRPWDSKRLQNHEFHPPKSRKNIEKQSPKWRYYRYPNTGVKNDGTLEHQMW